MIGLVIVGHGKLPMELLAAAEHVVGPISQAQAIGIDAGDDVEIRRQEIFDLVAALDNGEGVLVMTDMFGGTPSNLAIASMSRPNVEVVTGFNLPMLVKVAKSRTLPLGEIARSAVEAGRKYVASASDVLAGNP